MEVGRKIPIRTKLAYGLGGIADGLFLGIVTAFSALFYNQAVGLAGVWVGVATWLTLFSDAVSDPLVGSLSDRWRSVWGRRHPFIVTAAVPLAISLYFLFQPPDFLLVIPEGESTPNQLPLFFWMLVWSILGRFFLTLVSVPHMALGAELSTDYSERASIQSYSAMTSYFLGMMAVFVAWGLIFVGERPRETDGLMVAGQLDPAAYHSLAIFAALFIVLGVWACAFFTRKEIPHLGKPSEQLKPLSLKSVALEIMECMQNKSYLMLLAGFFFLSLNIGIYEMLNSFMATFFWEFKPETISLFGLAGGLGYLVGALLVPSLIHRHEKRPVAVLAVAIYALLSPLPVVARMAGVLPDNGSPTLLTMLLFHTFLMAGCLAALHVCVFSMLADIADEHELKTARRQEGVLFSARVFFAKASNSFSQLIAGISLTYVIQMPTAAIPGSVPDDVLFRLGLVSGPAAAVGAIIAIFFYNRYSLDRTRHAEIQKQLHQMKTKRVGLSNDPEKVSG